MTVQNADQNWNPGHRKGTFIAGFDKRSSLSNLNLRFLNPALAFVMLL